MKKRLFALFLALILCLGLAACGSSTQSSQNPAPAQSGKSDSSNPGSSTPAASANTNTEKGPPVEITVALSTVPTTLDHLTDNLLPAITLAWCVFDRLVNISDNGEWSPSIAKSWEKVDGRTWRFEIDLDAKFQNGDPLTMDDVVYSVMRLKDTPKSADVGKMVESATYEGNILTITFGDENNSTPTTVLWTATIVNKKYLEEGGDDALYLKPIGTGPWKVTEFTPSASCTVETWDGYPGKKPQIDIIHFIPINETATRYIALETGQVQYGDSFTALELELAESNPDMQTIVKQSNTIMAFIFSTKKPPFDNVNVRRALAYAIDRESMASLDPGSIPVASLVFGGYDEYYMESSKWPKFDLDKAKELLAAEGYDESNPLKFELISVIDRPAMQLLQSDLLKIGVEMTITRVEFSAYLPIEASGDFDMIYTGQSARGNHPLTDLARLDANSIGSRNASQYTDPKMQEIIQKMYVTDDHAELLRLDAELNELIADAVPALCATCGATRSIMTKDLTGVTIDPSGRGNFRNAEYHPS